MAARRVGRTKGAAPNSAQWMRGSWSWGSHREKGPFPAGDTALGGMIRDLFSSLVVPCSMRELLCPSRALRKVRWGWFSSCPAFISCSALPGIPEGKRAWAEATPGLCSVNEAPPAPHLQPCTFTSLHQLFQPFFFYIFLKWLLFWNCWFKTGSDWICWFSFSTLALNTRNISVTQVKLQFDRIFQSWFKV